MTVDSLRLRFGCSPSPLQESGLATALGWSLLDGRQLTAKVDCIAGAEVLQAVALLLSASISFHDAASPSRCLMPLALMAEYQDTIVAVALLAQAGALYSIGNVTSRASSSHGGALLRRPLCSPWCSPCQSRLRASSSRTLRLRQWCLLGGGLRVRGRCGDET